MNTDRVNRLRFPGNVDHDVQQSAPFEAVVRNINVLPKENRVLAEDRVSMMAIRIDGVSPIGKMRPEFAGEVLELRFGRPFLDRLLV